MPEIPHICDRCGETFMAWAYKRRRYCSMACRDHRTVEERWLAFVPDRPEGGCWIWTGARDRDGYGVFAATDPYTGGRVQRAHRAAFLLFVGAIPGGRMVRHRCDQPTCVNPAHLAIGSPADNSSDMTERGRSLPGERNRQAKLTAGQVVLIREQVAAGASIAATSRSHQVSEGLVRQIVRGTAWRHVGGPLTIEPRRSDGNPKLTAGQVADIRRRLTGRRGEQAALAQEFGVTPATVSAIARRVNWR